LASARENRFCVQLAPAFISSGPVPCQTTTPVDSKAGSLSVAHPAGPGKRLSRKIVDGKILTCDCALFLPLEDFGSD
jgi:hypothetical protein